MAGNTVHRRGCSARLSSAGRAGRRNCGNGHFEVSFVTSITGASYTRPDGRNWTSMLGDCRRLHSRGQHRTPSICHHWSSSLLRKRAFEILILYSSSALPILLALVLVIQPAPTASPGRSLPRGPRAARARPPRRGRSRGPRSRSASWRWLAPSSSRRRATR